MNIRLKCTCGAQFQTSDELRGHAVRCPKCKKTLRVPEAATVRSSAPAATPEPSSFFVPAGGAPVDPEGGWQAGRPPDDSDERGRTAWWKWALLALVLLVPVGVIATLVLVPYWTPKDPREQVAQRYLDAIRRDDWATANRLSVLTTHPTLRHVEEIALEGRDAPPVQGKFLGLGEFHAGIDKKYRFNPDTGRFELRVGFGTGIEVLGTLEERKKQIEEKAAADAANPPKRSGNPEDALIDDVLSRYGAISELASGAGALLSSKSLSPTYKDLLDKTDVSLSDAERALAAHCGADPDKWQRLLGRPFWELPRGGEFELLEAEIHAVIRTEGQSLGEPGRRITIRLVRFKMGTIDTGWRVWSAE